MLGPLAQAISFVINLLCTKNFCKHERQGKGDCEACNVGGSQSAGSKKYLAAGTIAATPRGREKTEKTQDDTPQKLLSSKMASPTTQALREPGAGAETGRSNKLPELSPLGHRSLLRGNASNSPSH